MRNVLSTFAASALALGLSVGAGNAATYTFSLADLTGFSVLYSSGLTPGADPSPAPGPAFSDGVTPLSGVAGATGELATGGYVYYGSDVSQAVSAGDVLQIEAFNDNNQDWGLDLWYNTADGVFGSIVADQATVTTGASTILSLLLPTTTIEEWGVSIHNVITQPDRYHSSWSAVPVPAALPLFGTGLALLGFFGWRKRNAA